MARKPQLNVLLRKARLSKGWTMQTVADAIGVTNACISNWEMGKSTPRPANLTAVCKTLRVPLRQARELAAQ